MGLFSKESCTFCSKEVGALNRSKLATSEYICNDCKKKTQPFARMDYTSREDAAFMMENVKREAEAFYADVAPDWKNYQLGSCGKVGLLADRDAGKFMLKTSETDRYETNAVLYFGKVGPYQVNGPAVVTDSFIERDFVTVDEEKDANGKVTACTLKIPYNDVHIREIRLRGSVLKDDEVKGFHALANELNSARKASFISAERNARLTNMKEAVNAVNTAADILGAKIKGADQQTIQEKLEKGVERAEAIQNEKPERKSILGFFKK